MEPTILVAVISAGGVLLAAVVSLLGVRYTQQQTRAAAERANALEAAAAERANAVERSKVDAQAFEHAKATWRENVADLRTRVDELATENERQRTTIRELRDRVDTLENGRAADRDRIRELTTWARDVLRILAEHGIAYPPPPEGLE